MNCGAAVGHEDTCPNCGCDLSIQRKAIQCSNLFYNRALDKAKVLVLPSALTDIGAVAVADIGAQVVKLPKGTKVKVQKDAFAGSEHLIAVIGEDTDKISGDAFAYPKNCIVFAPGMD